jgi:hypothetical protein
MLRGLAGATTVLSVGPFLLDRMQRHIHPKPTGNAVMRPAQNTASSMGPALYASAWSVEPLPNRNPTVHYPFFDLSAAKPKYY